ncbi:MAG: zf-HC2 domain-containing protein [Candidatus Rokubacteria bacterium]|nr:zf-HC2 domain-containing protein [Candidatus Rokubacteria bacterium]
MNCPEARELFSSRVDALLTPEQRRALDLHLQTCAECPREWERFRRTVSLLHSLEEARAPAGFAARVIEAARREPWLRRLLRNVFLPLHVKLPLEAAAIVLVSTLVIFLYRQTPEVQRAVEAPPSPRVAAPAAEPPAKSVTLEQRQRDLGAPSVPGVTAPPPASPPKAAESERVGALEAPREKDRPGKEEAAPAAEPPAVGGRMDAAREARKSAAPAVEPKPAARAQGPFHLVGQLKAKNLEALDSQLTDLVKQVGGILVRDAEPMGGGSIVEVIVSREAYPRLEAGLRQIGDFTVETRASSFPQQVRVALRIAE